MPEIRIRATEKKWPDWNKVRNAIGQGIEMRVYNEGDDVHFKVVVTDLRKLEIVRERLPRAGFEEIRGAGATAERGHSEQDPRRSGSAEEPKWPDIKKRPYGFVPLPDPKEMRTEPPIWHDGSPPSGDASERLSGEIRFELEALTPLLVGCERGVRQKKKASTSETSDEQKRHGKDEAVETHDALWPVPKNIQGVDIEEGKAVLCPLRAQWSEKAPVIIPGDSLKGLLRHELGALLGAPMERVGERNYSYRPNLAYPDKEVRGSFKRRLEPRLAGVVERGTIELNGDKWPVPKIVDVYEPVRRNAQTYYPRKTRKKGKERTSLPPPGAHRYKGGMGGGVQLPMHLLSEDAKNQMIRTHVVVNDLRKARERYAIHDEVLQQYRRTLEHLFDLEAGHFSARHPYTGNSRANQEAGRDSVKDAAKRAFEPSDIIWVEWDNEKKEVVSFGWHYYYRWAYLETVCRVGPSRERRAGLKPLEQEKEKGPDNAPKELSLVRRLFGYAGDNEGSMDIGAGDFSQLMGRISINAALEVVADGEKEEQRFLKPTFLRELGMPRPSAVEFYLKQPQYPEPGRPEVDDMSPLRTYGDALGYDTPGELAGRKFYLDRQDAYGDDPDRRKPWRNQASEEAERLNERSTLAIEASRPGRRFRFTLRFRDLEAWELAAVLVALCPNEFASILGGNDGEEYCSKLGYARPLGWGSVRIAPKKLLLLREDKESVSMEEVSDITAWVGDNYKAPHDELQQAWLDVHRRWHPDAADYPTRKGTIPAFHSAIRAEHSRARRYDRRNNR